MKLPRPRGLRSCVVVNEPGRSSQSTGHEHTSYRGVRALVIGATGFIGRQVATALATACAELHWTARAGDVVAVANRMKLRGCGHAVDLDDDAAVKKLVDDVRPTITFNLAGYGVARDERDEQAAARLNDQFVGVLAAALAARRDSSSAAWRGLELVHVGSALEYGRASGDLVETTEPQPTTLYGQTKLGGTQRLASVCATTKLRALTARPFMVYGPGEHAGRLLPSLIETATTRQPLPLTSGGQERDFIFVGDVVDALLRLGVATTARPGESVNVATGQLTSVRAFVEMAAHVLAIQNELLRFGALPARDEEMRHAPVAIGRLRALTGWAPPTGIEEGLHRTAVLRQ